MEGLTCSDFESTGSWDDCLVFNGVLDSAKTVTDGILGLGDGVVVGSLDKNGA